MDVPVDSQKPVIVPNRLAITVSVSLLSLAACAWIATYYLMPRLISQSNDMMMISGVAGIVGSSSYLSIPIFEIIWTIGMVAMMFPAMIPIVLFYNKIVITQEKSSLGRSVGTPLFVGGYLTIYAVLGFCAYLLLHEAIGLSTSFSGLLFLSVIASSAILIIAGIYQFSSLKSRCLRNCISPMGFFAVHYRSGLLGGLRMGLTHGYYCVGCCWAFMLVMLAVGAMSIPVMAILAGVIALEKIILRGAIWYNRLVAFGFISSGILVLIFPNILSLL